MCEQVADGIWKAIYFCSLKCSTALSVLQAQGVLYPSNETDSRLPQARKNSTVHLNAIPGVWLGFSMLWKFKESEVWLAGLWKCDQNEKMNGEAATWMRRNLWEALSQRRQEAAPGFPTHGNSEIKDALFSHWKEKHPHRLPDTLLVPSFPLSSSLIWCCKLAGTKLGHG